MKNQKLKIVFIGTPEFGAIILKELIMDGYKPALVIAAPDKPIGRKQIITSPPVKLLAEKYKIPILQPEKIEDSKSQITNYEPDLIVVAAYGQIIPKEILDIPKYGCLNVHPSLLPKYRGPSPIQSFILSNDKETGVTIMLMDERMDHGPILAQQELEFSIFNFQFSNLHNKLAELGTKLLIETIPMWINDEIKPKPQDEPKATYTKIIRKQDGEINWRESAKNIERQVRAFNPWPGTFTLFNNKIFKILKANIQEQTKISPIGLPGKTFLATNNKIAVQTGKDFLIIEELQIGGKRQMNVKEFLRGNLSFVGVVLK